MRTDVVVLGAGMIGVSVACHLAARGMSVVMIDRRDPGEETSYGNAGVIERSALLPVSFPHDIGFLFDIGLGRKPHASYHPTALPRLARWLAAYWWHSTPARREATARALFPMIDRSLDEHKALMADAGSLDLLAEKGWIRLYREEKSLRAEEAELALARQLGVPFDELSREATVALEPGLAPEFLASILWPTSASVSDPGAVTKSYAKLAERRGARYVRGDGRTLARAAGGWTVQTDAGALAADQVVVALGPWSLDVLAPLGLKFPLAVKRGYHMHFSVSGPGLERPVVDVDGGYVLAPMRQGMRLTTGVEFAERDAIATPIQVERSLPAARRLLPGLGQPVEAQAWLGRRPALPDSLPIIGPAPGQGGLWLAFGHQHLGFTLGPITGRLVADLVERRDPVVDPAPYRAERFGPKRSRQAGSARAKGSATAS